MKLITIAAVGLGLSACCTVDHVHRYERRQAAAQQVRSYSYRVHRPRSRHAALRHRQRLAAPVAVATYQRPQMAVVDGCGPLVRVVGPDAWTERGAYIKAERAWRSQVRFDFGEGVSDLKRARDISVQCARASANESALGKVGEKVAGGLAVRDRCVIAARPCER